MKGAKVVDAGVNTDTERLLGLTFQEIKTVISGWKLNALTAQEKKRLFRCTKTFHFFLR